MKKVVINTREAPAPIGPYNQAIQSNNLLFVSGQIAIHPDNGELEVTDIGQETRRVMENLGAILRAAGLNFSQVVKCTLFIRNMDEFSRINEVYGSYFPVDPPARETIEVNRLPKNVNVEISCIAAQ